MTSAEPPTLTGSRTTDLSQDGLSTTDRSVTLRFASPADQGPLARLAELDSSTPPAQPVLLAEIDGQLRAALALTDGTVVADPFHPTADLIELLRARARQLNATPQLRRSRRPRSPFPFTTTPPTRLPATARGAPATSTARAASRCWP